MQQDIDTDPRKHVIDDLSKELQQHMNNGDFIILMSDLNENVNSREKTNDRFNQMGLTNVLQHRLCTNNLPPTHRRGSQAIDHIWISASLTNSITACGYAPFEFLGNSETAVFLWTST